MDKEINILNYISKNNNVTQREIAQNTGLSLGAVNILLKKMISKGLVKIEHLTPKSIKYILTPKGIKEKAEKTYKYVVNTYNQIMEIRKKITTLINRLLDDKNDKIYFYGKNDEVAQIIRNIIKENQLEDKCKVVSRIDMINNNSKIAVVIWEKQAEKNINKNGNENINIMEMIEF